MEFETEFEILLKFWIPKDSEHLATMSERAEKYGLEVRPLKFRDVIFVRSFTKKKSELNSSLESALKEAEEIIGNLSYEMFSGWIVIRLFDKDFIEVYFLHENLSKMIELGLQLNIENRTKRN